MSLFDICCLNTSAKYHIPMQNQKVKRNLLIHVFVYLTYTYILNARFGTERIYTYIVLIHHVGMGPLTTDQSFNEVMQIYHGSVPTSWQSGNSRVHNDQTRKGIGVSFRESQQTLFACSFNGARCYQNSRIDGLLLARTEKASFEEGAICPSLNTLKYGTPMSYLESSDARHGIGLPFSPFLAVADTGKWWVNLFAKHVILCDFARCF